MINNIRFPLGLTRKCCKVSSAALFFNFLFSSTVFAASFTLNKTPDVATMLLNFSETIPSFMRLVTAIAYVMGFFFIIKGVMELKHFGEQRSMMSHEHHIMKPITYLFVGGMLLYLPAGVQAGLSTFWTNPTPYAYISDTDGGDAWAELTNAVFMLIQLIGTIAFIRGLIILTHVGGGHGGQPGTFGKALAYMVSGILCLNLFQFLQAVVTTLNIGTLS